ncbi:MAG: endonuclease VII domain-containing protein [Promethearchaeota archaeon]
MSINKKDVSRNILEVGINEDKTKRCSKCKQVFLATTEFFYKNRNLKHGIDSWCKACKKKYDKIYHKLKNFNLSIKEFEKLLEQQNYKCAICGRNFNDLFEIYNNKTTVRTPRIDHDHKSGKIRGILCNRCNMLLGRCVDNPFILIKAVNYLKGN